METLRFYTLYTIRKVNIEAIKRLKRAGFIATRQKGSHVRLERYTGEKTIKITVPVPVHANGLK